jgi:putative polyketide hydroxylase
VYRYGAHAAQADYLPHRGGRRANSSIRRRLGIDVDGPGVLYHHLITAIVEADLTPALRGRRVDIACVPQAPAAVHSVLLAHYAVGKHWVFGTGYDPKRESIEEDYYTDESGSSSGWFVLRPACLSEGWRSSYVPRFAAPTSKCSRVQHRCPGRARQYRAGRQGVFLAGDSARIVNPPTDRWARRQPAESVQDSHNLAWKLWQRCSTARLVPRYSIPITMNGTDRTAHYMQQAFARLGSRMGQGAEVPHSSTMGR